jgi:transcriptional regulator with XRE-family HTH domain
MPKLLPLLLKRLKELRKSHGLTQEGFAEIAGLSYKYYQQIEAGRKRELQLSTLERLASGYGIEVWQLLGPHTPNTKLSKKRRQIP